MRVISVARKICLPPGGIGDPSDDPTSTHPSRALGSEDLPYRVELWDEAKTSVESVIALALTASVGYAAYFAAFREYHGRHITIRHNDRIMSRSD